MKQYNFNLIYKPFSKKRLITKIAFSSLLFGIIIASIAAYFLGFRAFSVLGWSSEPDIMYRSLAIDYKIPFEEIKTGDFITAIFGTGLYVTHKVVETHIDEGYVVTQGNRNENTTETVYRKNFAGKVLFSINEVGGWLYDIKNLVIKNRSINILGIMSIVLTTSAIMLFSKLTEVQTFYLKEI